MSDATLSLKGLTKAYNPGLANEIVVLKGVDLDLAAGEIVALVAPSGAGKSTLLHLAGLLDVPDAGSIRLSGQEMVGRNDRARTMARRREIGFVYQFHHLLPEFSALENIALPQLAAGCRRAEADARARDLLGRVGLAERADHRPAELSGGEAQRVAFCRALANAPKVLLADEPTGNLDPGISETVFSVLTCLVRDTGMTALIATHNMALAAQMDRTVRLEGGHLHPV